MNNYKEILEKITKTNPPTDIALIEELSNLSWLGLDHDDRELCVDIILRITADAIVIKDIDDISFRSKYNELLTKICSNVISSDICSANAEFNQYFLKFRRRVYER
jgi:hypothetical protein